METNLQLGIGFRGGYVLIKSPAGEFPITIERFEVEGSELVIVGKMGVWDARTHVGPRDFLRVLGKLVLSPAVLLFALKAPFAAVHGSASD
jgi:hypothetical protein